MKYKQAIESPNVDSFLLTLDAPKQKPRLLQEPM